MNYFLSPVPHRWEQAAPVTPVLPYGSFPSFPEDEADRNRSGSRGEGGEAQGERAKPQAAPGVSETMTGMRRFAQGAERLVAAARDVAASAVRLRSAAEPDAAEMEAFAEYVQRMIGSDNAYFQLLSDLPPYEDSAYLPGDGEIVAYWEQKALAVLAAPPIELVWDEDALPAYAGYNGDRQKVWQLPRQGLIIQTYG